MTICPNCRVIQLRATVTKLRTTVTEGQWGKPPEVGDLFEVFADPCAPGADLRYIQTSPIVELTEIHGIWILLTESGSLYSVEPI